ncbi:MAG: metallopeptidase TldD-related protein [Methanomicrobiaceae archaeon]|nr:metallopeptidase TldD-related protein [Methanomicrobiaceae archaeon]
MPDHDLVEKVLAAGRRRCDEVEVYLLEGRSVEAELKRSLVGEATESLSCAIGIRTIDDGRIGASSTSNPSRWQECLEAALSGGKFSTPQEWHGLPGPAVLDREVPIFDPRVAVDPASARALLGALLIGASDHPAEVVGGSAALGITRSTLANSSGAYYTRERTDVSVSLETICGTSTGFEFDRSCFMDVDPREVGERAAFYAVHSSRAQEIASGSYDVILSPIAASQLLEQIIVPALSGRNVQVGRSFFAGKIGEQVMDSSLSIRDDPFTRGLGSTTWDAEGVPTRILPFVERGVLGCFAYDLRTAYRYGEESTGSAVRSGAGGTPGIGMHNLVVDGPRTDVDDERAIFIHNLVGAHTANPVSGDFSVQLANPTFVEGGNFAEPIHSAMLAGNIFEMLADVGGIGKDTRIVGRTILPSIRFKKIGVIGK